MGEVFLEGVADLFGDPVPASRGRKGRPPHVPTQVNRRRVELALACGHDEDAIAAMLRITPSTLRRHYFSELAGRAAARLRLDMVNMEAIVDKALAGKVAAMALLEKKLQRMEQREVTSRHQRAEPKGPALGKKEAARAAAREVGGMYAPRRSPALLN